MVDVAKVMSVPRATELVETSGMLAVFWMVGVEDPRVLLLDSRIVGNAPVEPCEPNPAWLGSV